MTRSVLIASAPPCPSDGEMGPPAVPQSAKSVGGFRYPNPSVGMIGQLKGRSLILNCCALQSSHQVSPEKQSIKSGQSSPNKAGSGDLAGRKRMPDEDVDQWVAFSGPKATSAYHRMLQIAHAACSHRADESGPTPPRRNLGA